MEYEYKITKFDGSNSGDDWNRELEHQLNDFGAKGWRLVCVHAVPYLGSTRYSLIGIGQQTLLIFSRTKRLNNE